MKNIMLWCLVVVFGFGLLYGLGFVLVLGEYGLLEGMFILVLIGFNIGVEVGQLFVIVIVFVVVGYWFGKKDWYCCVIFIFVLVVIGIIGVWWVIECILL